MASATLGTQRRLAPTFNFIHVICLVLTGNDFTLSQLTDMAGLTLSQASGYLM